MKKLSIALIVAGMSLSAAGAFAQDATGAMKKDTTVQDCRDQANTAKGEKRNDTPVNADTDKKCAEMSSAKKSPHMKKSTAKAGGQAASSAM